MSEEIALMSLTAVAKAIAARQVSSEEVTRSCLHRIAQWQPKLNAFMSVEGEHALKAADELASHSCVGRSTPASSNSDCTEFTAGKRRRRQNG